MAARPEGKVPLRLPCVSFTGIDSWNLIKTITYVPGLPLSLPALFGGTGLCSHPQAGDAVFSELPAQLASPVVGALRLQG